MSDHNFTRAHEQYLTPPEDKSVECDECGGDGTVLDVEGFVTQCTKCDGYGTLDAVKVEQDHQDEMADRKRDQMIDEEMGL